jgi:hypothetical protein
MEAKLNEYGNLVCPFERLEALLGYGRRVDPAVGDGKVKIQWRGSRVDVGSFDVYDYRSDLPVEQNLVWSVRATDVGQLVKDLNDPELVEKAEDEREMEMEALPELAEMLTVQWRRAGEAEWREYGDCATRVARYRWWILVAYSTDGKDAICAYDARTLELVHRVDLVTVYGPGATGWPGAAPSYAPGEQARRDAAERAAWAAAAGAAD